MFYKKVKYLCDKNGISMTKLTNDLRCSQSNVTRWKDGAEPRPKIVKAVADYFGVDVSYFYEQNVKNSNINPAVTRRTVAVSSDRKHSRVLSEIESELLSICEKLNTKDKVTLLAKAYVLLDCHSDEE